MHALSTIATSTCQSNSTLFGTDFVNTVRVPQYPNGLPAANWSTCCDICSDLSLSCVAWVFMIKENLCFPVATYEGSIPNADRILGFNPPPPPPPEWVPKIAAFDMLYSPTDSNIPEGLMPMIGNGFLATQLTSTDLYCAGVFNGEGLESGSHRARIPATFNIGPPGIPGAAALDVREATYFRRSNVAFNATCGQASGPEGSCTTNPGGVTVEQRFYAHRALPSVAVMEVQVLGTVPVGTHTQLALVNNAGPSTTDFNFTAVPPPPAAPYTGVQGSTLGTECPPGACGPDVVTELVGVAVLTTALPTAGGVVTVPVAEPNSTLYFLTGEVGFTRSSPGRFLQVTLVPLGQVQGAGECFHNNHASFLTPLLLFLGSAVVRTSIETTPPTSAAILAAAQSDFASAVELAAAGTLRSSHVEEWANTLWTSGFDTDRRDVALAVNTSLYSILSSLRPDRPFSTSPGGLANDVSARVLAIHESCGGVQSECSEHIDMWCPLLAGV
jgi:hypothetical protein